MTINIKSGLPIQRLPATKHIKLINIHSILNPIQKVVNYLIDETLGGFDITTTNFEQTEPEFIIEELESRSDDETVYIIAPKDDHDGLIWKFLESGTKVRYAVLSTDWQSKTSPDTIASGRGSGRVLFIDTSRPMDGIEARDWTKIIATTVTDLLSRRLKIVVPTIDPFG